MNGPGAAALAVLMLASFALAIGGGRMLAKGGDRRKGVLMLIAAAVFAGNVLIWTV